MTDVPIAHFDAGGTRYAYHDLRGALAAAGLPEPEAFPASLLVLVESLLHERGGRLTGADVDALVAWRRGAGIRHDLPWRPARVLLQDYTGIPVLVDLAALREAARARGLPAHVFGCRVPADLVIDHALSVDHSGTPEALAANAELEGVRNAQRFEFLRWAANSFDGLRVFPPGSGICHQINMEHLATVVGVEPGTQPPLARPDSVLGADSHTTTINGLGVLGWGVGGIEALSALLGRTQTMPWPEVLGVRLHNRLPPLAGATDLVLALTERLREHGVVGRFVEFFGDGVAALSATDRATIANMAPETGATCAYFPIDDETLSYLRQTCRSAEHVERVRVYARLQGLWRDARSESAHYTQVLDFDLADVEPCVAGPSRPEQRIALSRLPGQAALDPSASTGTPGGPLNPGDVVLAAITSCTNTANPHSVMAAGLLARNAARRGLRARPWVKTSFAPGSRVVADYLRASGLQTDLDALGFALVGFGCTTCIGNAGPLLPQVAQALADSPQPVAAVLSGNRNFAYRIHAQVGSNYLASPALVLAFALAGNIGFDFERQPLGTDAQGEPVRLADLWPSRAEVDEAVRQWVRPELYEARYGRADAWAADAGAPAPAPDPWAIAPSYVARPPLLELEPPPRSILGARVLASYADGLTTDQISPAAPIQPGSAAAHLLEQYGVDPGQLHTFGARRGHWRVMLEGAFSNPSARNELLQPARAGRTAWPDTPDGLSIQEAARRYRGQGVPLVIVAGRHYGVGSSRDDAAKSTRYLGVLAVLAQSFERIHRSNLLALGVLPLQFPPGEDRRSLGLDAHSVLDLDLDGLHTGSLVVPLRIHGRDTPVELRACIDTPDEWAYWRSGGLLPWLLEQAAGATCIATPA